MIVTGEADDYEDRDDGKWTLLAINSNELNACIVKDDDETDDFV
jgi:hypothetical protein